MSRFSVSVAATGFALLTVAVAVPVQSQAVSQTQPQAQTQTQAQAQTQEPLSRVRIVRLSEVKGAVQLDRGVGHGFEPAIVNMPVVEQNRLRTGVGVAEVEFEDNSTLRVGPDSEVDFYVLGRTAQGNTVSTVRVARGIAYVSLVKASGKTANVFDLAFGKQRNIQLQPDTHVRLEVDGQQAKLAVLSGTVHLDGLNGAADVARKHTATFALAGDAQPAVAKGIVSDSLLDTWDKQLDQYHSRVASLNRFGGVPYSYGVNDMLYYGAFENADGCGMMWRPYFASAAWDPYSNGTWAYYSGAGYSWVSPYPWGWTPYHYGSWAFCQGTGWGWMPGGSWMGINNIAAATATMGTPVIGAVVRRRNHTLPHPPRFGGPSLVSVNRVALVHSGLSERGSFVFRKDSAGLGVPRNELGSLRGFSKHADRRGVATTPIYFSYAPRETSGMRGGVRMAPAPVAIHRGYAPTYGGFAGARSSSNVGSAGGSSMPSAPASMPMPSAPSMGSVHASVGRGSH